MNHRLHLQKISVSGFVEPHFAGRSTAILKQTIITIEDEKIKE